MARANIARESGSISSSSGSRPASSSPYMIPRLTGGPKTSSNSRMASSPGKAGAAASTSWPSDASSSPVACMPRTHSGSTSTPSGFVAVMATRRRPGLRRMLVAYGSAGRGAQLASPTS